MLEMMLVALPFKDCLETLNQDIDDLVAPNLSFFSARSPADLVDVNCKHLQTVGWKACFLLAQNCIHEICVLLGFIPRCNSLADAVADKSEPTPKCLYLTKIV